MWEGDLDQSFLFVLHIAQITYIVAATEIPSVPGQCILLFALQLPFNTPARDVDHYVVNIPSANITTHKNLSLFTLLVPRCSSSMHITIESVDHCGHMGPKTIIIPYLLPKDDVPEPPHDCVQCEYKGGVVVYIPCLNFYSVGNYRQTPTIVT